MVLIKNISKMKIKDDFIKDILQIEIKDDFIKNTFSSATPPQKLFVKRNSAIYRVPWQLLHVVQQSKKSFFPLKKYVITSLFLGISFFILSTGSFLCSFKYVFLLKCLL